MSTDPKKRTVRNAAGLAAFMMLTGMAAAPALAGDRQNAQLQELEREGEMEGSGELEEPVLETRRERRREAQVKRRHTLERERSSESAQKR